MTEIYASFIRDITLLQFKINSYISTLIREESSLSLFLLVTGIAFLYGSIHALGPGHGKALVSFYFIKSESSYKKAFKMGYLVSAFHALSALSVTVIIYFILSTIFSKTFREFSHASLLISGVLIVLVGVYTLFELFRAKRGEGEEFKESSKSEILTAFSAGVVPCPGVMSIVLFAISLKKYFLAFVATISMSIGMGLTISLAAILTLTIQKRFISNNSKIAYTLPIISAFLIMFLGLFLLYTHGLK